MSDSTETSSIESFPVRAYSDVAFPHLKAILENNEKNLEFLAKLVFEAVKAGQSLFVFGSGHSAIFPLELYHRAGGASFVVPVVADYLLPTAGPPVVRLLERTAEAANALLRRADPRPGEMLWLASQSGINSAVVDLALEAKKRGMRTVAFTSLAHSRAVASRHPSGKKLFEACDHVVDLGGVPGDAAIRISESVSTGPLSTLGMVFLGNTILSAAISRLEREGIRCVYTSVNTAQGEARNRDLEEQAKRRDPLLR